MSEFTQHFRVTRAANIFLPPNNTTSFIFTNDSARVLAMKSREMTNTIDRVDGRYILREPDGRYTTLFDGDMLTIHSVPCDTTPPSSSDESTAISHQVRDWAKRFALGEVTEEDVEGFLEASGDEIIAMLRDLLTLHARHTTLPEWTDAPSPQNYFDQVKQPLANLLFTAYKPQSSD